MLSLHLPMFSELIFFHFSSYSSWSAQGLSVPHSVYSSALKMEAVYPSETLVIIYQTTRHHIPEGNFYIHCCEKFECRIEILDYKNVAVRFPEGIMVTLFAIASRGPGAHPVSCPVNTRALEWSSAQQRLQTNVYMAEYSVHDAFYIGSKAAGEWS
jgi:hypothetical protein